MVHSLFKIERHDLGTLGGDLLLTAWRRTEAKAIEETKQRYKRKPIATMMGVLVLSLCQKR